MLIKVGILKSRIETDNPKLLEALCDLYSFKAPGAEFTPAYRRGWDGKTRFISNAGIFRSGLLQRILTDLKKIDCVPEIEYRDPQQEQQINDWGIPNFSLYDYQENFVARSIKEKRGIIKSSTGSGKTLIIAAIVKALLGRKIVILFNAKQLLKQTYEFLTEDCALDGIGLCFGEGYIYGDVMLCTIQSIEKILDTHLEDTEALLIDEVHEFSNGKTTLAAIQSFPKATYRLGFTATVPSDSIPRYNLEGALGSVWEEITTSSLIEQGVLTKPIIQLVKLKKEKLEDYEDLSYSEIYDTFIINNKNRNNIIKDIIDEIRKDNHRARILVLTKNLDHGKTLEKLIGGECKFLEGANSLGERYKSISRFRTASEPSVLIGTKILQTGINIKEITHFINARGLKSEIATLQALGRSLRQHESKTQVFVYDFLDTVKYLKAHAAKRKKYYKQEGHEIVIL
tara:strand:- start:744 stop:2111 length:1368 start_codon:yes stop_codon:yes gene_type:complete